MKVYLELDENNFIIGWSTSPDIGVETDLDINDKRLLNCYCYQYIDGELVYNDINQLAEAKQLKLDELTKECSQRILDGFHYPVRDRLYKFGFSTSDQSNLTSTMVAMNMGLLNEIEWTVELEGQKVRITLEKELFFKICQYSLLHKNEKIVYLRDWLQPMIEKAETIEEVNKIQWGV